MSDFYGDAYHLIQNLKDLVDEIRLAKGGLILREQIAEVIGGWPRMESVYLEPKVVLEEALKMINDFEEEYRK